VNGGGSPSYQWKVNGINAGTNSPTYTTNTLSNGDVVTCVLTSSIATCTTGNPATSNSISMTVNYPPLVVSETHVNVSCNGNSNGTATISATGGNPPYTGTGTFTGLAAGTYTYT